MRFRLVACLVALYCIAPASAQPAPTQPASARSADESPTQPVPAVKDLDVVVVTGTWGGPRMWKISKGDHVLWILGTLTPLPAKMTWDSSHAERIVAQAQEVLAAPSVSVSADGIGFFRGLFLIPSLLSVRKNPGDATLKDVMPPDLYARWIVLKKKYIGRDAGIEKWRPLFAGSDSLENENGY